MDFKEALSSYKIVPVVVLNDLGDVDQKLGGLLDGGLPIAEITFRTECAAEAISLAAKKFQTMLIGAGTVINVTQCEKAIAAGARFIVSPGFCADIAQLCKAEHIPYLPGAITPTEIMQVLAQDITTIKFFPASCYGGLKTIKALCAPFPQISLVPTGGIGAENLMEYLSFPKVIACGGSWMMNGDRVQIAKAVKEALQIVKGEIL